MIHATGMLTAATALAVLSGSTLATGPTKGGFAVDIIPRATWRFGGELGRRIDANVQNWVLRAPATNPGLTEMFHRRDRHLPYETPVPWAGEFAGKYLISSVQACRMSDDPRLRGHVQSFVDALIAGQADDGYLGPWRKEERLLGHWDLWGHYHCMLGLLMWYDDTGDQKAFDCAVRAADCICDIYVGGDRRPIEAGTPQINLSVLHVMGNLYRRTGEPRYRAFMQRIEEDLPKDGDWLQLGAKGVPYFRLPGGGTRWESLHIVQGLLELYRITGRNRYRKAVLQLWDSIREFDRHPSGAFSTHERALGSVYEAGSIETCCSVAWEALTIDVLRLTGDPSAADELELTTWNQVLGAQHPSGSWWTYDTPMDGVRIPSFHHIRFQARPGTPELNCCSVNAPRGLGMLSEWAVLQEGSGLVINLYAPFTCTAQHQGQTITLRQETAYPIDGAIRLEVRPASPCKMTLKLRIPHWCNAPKARVNGMPAEQAPSPGSYFSLERTWISGDVVELDLDLPARSWMGQDGRHGRAAVYSGPLLLAFDAYYNSIESKDLPALDASALTLQPKSAPEAPEPGRFAPLGLWEVTTADGQAITLCDFASAGAHGTDYVAWLPAINVPPPTAKLQVPGADAVGAPGPIRFRWTTRGHCDCTFDLVVAKDAALKDVVAREESLDSFQHLLGKSLAPGTYYWKIVSRNAHGVVENRDGPRAFTVDPNAEASLLSIRDDGVVIASGLDGDATPEFGVCTHQKDLTPAQDRFGKEGGAVGFNGSSSEIRYAAPFFPEEDYSFTAWVYPDGLPRGLGQIFSAWCVGMDDPLRVCIDGKQVFARIEAGNSLGTKGVPVTNNEWVHFAAVKNSGKLTLYVNGAAKESHPVAQRIYSMAKAIGIGFNPLYSGGEHFQGRIDDIAFYAKALTAEEIAAAYAATKPSTP